MPSYAEITSRAAATDASQSCMILDDDELERQQAAPKRGWRTAEQLATDRIFSAKGGVPTSATNEFPTAFQSYRPGRGFGNAGGIPAWGSQAARTTPLRPSSSTEPPGTLQRAVRTVFYDAEKGVWAPISAASAAGGPAASAAYSHDLSGNSISLE